MCSSDLISILQPLSTDELEILARRVSYLTYTEKEIVFRENNPGDSFYIIKRGSVEVCKEEANGELFPIVALEKEDYFGEMSLLTGEKRTATIRVVEDTELIVIGKNAFQDILEANPSVIEELSKALHQRQIETSSKLTQIKDKLERAPIQVESSTSLLKSIRKFFHL